MSGGRHKTFKTEGIVLSRRDIGEADRILTVFTRDEGIVRLKARGVRKMKSRMSGHLELYTEAELFLAKGHGDDVIAGAGVINSHEPIRTDLELMARAAMIAEFALVVIPFGVPNEELYELTKWALSSLPHADARVVAFYTWRVMSLSGFVSDLKDCAVCVQPLEAIDIEFVVSEARFAHRRCVIDRAVQSESVKLIKLLSEGKWELVARIRVGRAILDEVQDLASLYIAGLIKKPLISAWFVKRLEGI